LSREINTQTSGGVGQDSVAVIKARPPLIGGYGARKPSRLEIVGCHTRERRRRASQSNGPLLEESGFSEEGREKKRIRSCFGAAPKDDESRAG